MQCTILLLVHLINVQGAKQLTSYYFPAIEMFKVVSLMQRSCRLRFRSAKNTTHFFFRNFKIKILEINGPKPHFRYDVRHSGGLQVNLDPLRIFNIRQNADTRLVSFFASVRKTANAARIEHTSLGSTVRLRH